MRKTIGKAILAGALGCLALCACSTAYAATKTTDTETENDQPAQEAAADADTKNTSAQEALDLLKDLLAGGGIGHDTGEEAGSAKGSAEMPGTIALTAAPREPRTVTVSAQGTAKAVPDKAEISFGVTTQAKTADAAQKENAEKIDKVITHLKERGIEEKSIRTSSYNLYPDYDYSGNNQKIIGYQVRTTLTITDQEIDDAGDIVSECVALGINDVDNFRFYASSYDEAYEEALKSAVAAAGAKAAVLAGCTGDELGPVLSLSEGYQDTSYRYSKARYAMAEEAAADNAAGFGMAVMPGEASITAQVTITYELR